VSVDTPGPQRPSQPQPPPYHRHQPQQPQGRPPPPSPLVVGRVYLQNHHPSLYPPSLLQSLYQHPLVRLLLLYLSLLLLYLIRLLLLPLLQSQPQ
jgi:hypothetical protein